MWSHLKYILEVAFLGLANHLDWGPRERACHMNHQTFIYREGSTLHLVRVPAPGELILLQGDLPSLQEMDGLPGKVGFLLKFACQERVHEAQKETGDLAPSVPVVKESVGHFFFGVET